MINGEVGEIAKANDCLCSGDEGLCKIADGGSEYRAGKDPHVEVQPDSEAPNEHEPGCITCALLARGGNHMSEKLSVGGGSDKPGVRFGEEKGERSGVRGESDGCFVCSGGCRTKDSKA